MAESNRRIINRFITDDVTLDMVSAFEQDNAASPAVIENQSLASGNNTITKPDDAVAVTIKPPDSNIGDDEVTITLKGVNGDTGIAIHPTAPTSIGLDSTVTSFVLNASDDLDDVRLIWS